MLHSSLDITVTSTSWSVDAGLPSAPVSPQPVTVATWPVYRDWVEAGRQMGAIVVLRGKVKNNMEKSKSAFSLLYLGWILILDTSLLSTSRSDVSCSPTKTWNQSKTRIQLSVLESFIENILFINHL